MDVPSAQQGEGRVEIVYYGTSGTEDPTTSNNDQWRVFFAQSLNAADREPTFTVSEASDHITHVGQICNVGILCSGNTRNLLDFFQVAIGPDGVANIAWTDTGTQAAGAQDSTIYYARQSGGPLALTNPSSVTCLPGPPIPTSVVSRKTHGNGAGTFEVPLPLPPNGIGIECRTGGLTGDHSVVVTFALPVTVSGNGTVKAQVTSGTGDVGTGGVANGNAITVSGAVVTIPLTNVADIQRLNITIFGVSDGTNSGNVVIPMGVLLGDVNASGIVTTGDVNLCKGQALQPLTNANFRDDINISGTITTGDVNIIKQNSLHQLPP